MFDKIDKLKDEAALQYKKGLYEEAVTIYEKAAKVSHDEASHFKYKKKDLISKEASIYSNMAACYK